LIYLLLEIASETLYLANSFPRDLSLGYAR
jgi:hypothetical protein